MKNNIFLALRWVAVLPAAALSLCLAPVILYCLEWLSIKLNGSGNEDGWFLMYITPIMGNALGGYCYIKVATEIAPSFKKNTALILFIILVLLCGITIFNLTMRREYLKIIETIASLITATIAFVDVERNDNYKLLDN